MVTILNFIVIVLLVAIIAYGCAVELYFWRKRVHTKKVIQMAEAKEE